MPALVSNMAGADADRNEAGKGAKHGERHDSGWRKEKGAERRGEVRSEHRDSYFHEHGHSQLSTPAGHHPSGMSRADRLARSTQSEERRICRGSRAYVCERARPAESGEQ